MSRDPDTGPAVRRVVLILDADRWRQLLDVVSYVEETHMFIDPDMYRIDLEQLASLKMRLQGSGGLPATCIAVTYRELLALETIVEAAETYAHRRHAPPLDGVTRQDLMTLDSWLTRSERWFRDSGDETE